MTSALLRGEVRQRIGNPNQNTCPDRELDSFIIPSVQWLAGHLKFSVVTDSSIDLIAEQREYPIPPQCLLLSWVSIAGHLLAPNSVWALNSGAGTTQTPSNSGQTWMSVPSGTPSQYAASGHKLILYPPASADYIAGLSPAVMSWRYVDAGAYFTQNSEMGLSPQGIPALTDLDLAVVQAEAAKSWLSAHLLGQDQNGVAAMQAQIAALQREIDTRLPECKHRWEGMIEDYTPTHRVETSGRYIAAR